jgi:hypothetical protein
MPRFLPASGEALSHYGRLRRGAGSVPADDWTDDELLTFWRAHPGAGTENMSEAEVIAGLRSGQQLTGLDLDYTRSVCTEWGLAIINMPRLGEPAFELTGSSFLVDSALQSFRPGGWVSPEARFLAAPVRSTAGAPFASNVILEITDAGRAELARHQIFVCEGATTEDAQATGQEFYGRGVGVMLGGLGAGRERTVYFPVHVGDPVDGRVGGETEVEFVLYRSSHRNGWSWSDEVRSFEEGRAKGGVYLGVNWRLPPHMLAVATFGQDTWFTGGQVAGAQVVHAVTHAALRSDLTSASSGISGSRPMPMGGSRSS